MPLLQSEFNLPSPSYEPPRLFEKLTAANTIYSEPALNELSPETSLVAADPGGPDCNDEEDGDDRSSVCPSTLEQWGGDCSSRSVKTGAALEDRTPSSLTNVVGAAPPVSPRHATFAPTPDGILTNNISNTASHLAVSHLIEFHYLLSSMLQAVLN